MSNLRILIVEIFPNLLPMIVIAMSTTVGWMILETAGLSFLGLGSQPPQADLGSMLGEARSALITNPHTSFVPGIMIFFIVIGINLFGDGVRDALDPRLKKEVSSDLFLKPFMKEEKLNLHLPLNYYPSKIYLHSFMLTKMSINHPMMSLLKFKRANV